jgi:uncharacterized protein (TIGR02145 family)
MKRFAATFLSAAFVLAIATACSDKESYEEVVIGTQTWMVENLATDKFRNGDPIKEAKTNAEWIQAAMQEEPAWCYYNNDPSNGSQYGKLYNWYAVNDPRGLAPAGWRIPSNSDWQTLINFVGGEDVAGRKLKSTFGWFENGNGDNLVGFSGLPSGFRNVSGEFELMGIYGYLWSSSPSGGFGAWYLYLAFYANESFLYDEHVGFGLSVRCVK